MKFDVLIFSQEKTAALVYSSLGRPQIPHAQIDECFLCPPLLPVVPLKSDVCVRTRIFPPINDARLPHGSEKTTLSFHKLFFLPSPCCLFFFFSEGKHSCFSGKKDKPNPSL